LIQGKAQLAYGEGGSSLFTFEKGVDSKGRGCVFGVKRKGGTIASMKSHSRVLEGYRTTKKKKKKKRLLLGKGPEC